jgi:hypothetical protein
LCYITSLFTLYPTRICNDDFHWLFGWFIQISGYWSAWVRSSHEENSTWFFWQYVGIFLLFFLNLQVCSFLSSEITQTSLFLSYYSLLIIWILFEAKYHFKKAIYVGTIFLWNVFLFWVIWFTYSSDKFLKKFHSGTKSTIYIFLAASWTSQKLDWRGQFGRRPVLSENTVIHI